MNPIFYIDFYKVGHVVQYPTNVTKVWSNWTPRYTRVDGQKYMIHFGIQYFILKYLIDEFQRDFFSMPWEFVEEEYREVISETLFVQRENVKVDHIRQLWEYGRLPINIYSLPEGTKVPLNVPAMVLTNTEDWAFWLPNYLETIMSAILWKPSTSATTTHRYRELFLNYAKLAGETDFTFVDWMGHDFSFRGMSGLEDAILSGMGHLLSFSGTDTIPAILAAKKYYGAQLSIGGSVNATEHSVMTSSTDYSSGEPDEFGMFNRLINEVYPSGIVSIVSDSFDLWKVLTDYIPRLKEDILNRQGKIVVRPDCYDDQTEVLTNRGFVLFSDLEKTDLVGSYQKDGSIKFVHPLKYYNEYYDGDMLHFYNKQKHLDLMVTPNHRMVRKSHKVNDVQLIIADKIKYFDNYNWIHAGELNTDNFVVELTPEERINIAFQADGSFNTTGSKNKIRFNFTKKRKVQTFRNLLNLSGFEYKETIEPARPQNTQFYVTLPNEAQKTLEWVFGKLDHIDANWAKSFIEEISNWDSCVRSNTRIKYDTTVRINAEVVQTIATLAGYRTCLSSYEDTRKNIFSTVYTVNINKINESNGQSVKKEQVQYSGQVYCVQVDSGMLVVRRNNCVSVSGNSGDPVKIVCGDKFSSHPHASKGTLRLLSEALGVTERPGKMAMINNAGCIYGDAITLDRANQILGHMVNEAKLSPYNMVFGIGSFTYEYVTRDNYGLAMKATAIEVVNEDGTRTIRAIFKKPVTDDGGKISHKGIVSVHKNEKGELVVKQNSDPSDLDNCEYQLYFADGYPQWEAFEDFDEIRRRVRG